MALEKKTQKKVVNHARTNNFIALKVNVGSQRGWPDYVLIDPAGWHVWIEFKKPGETPDPLQVYRGTQLTDRGVAVLVVDSWEQGKEYIDAMVAARVPEESDKATAESGFSGLILRPGTREN